MLLKLPGLELAGLVLAWIAATAVVGWLVVEGRRVALARGERAAAGVAALVEQQTARTFQAVHLTLAAAADAHHLAPRPGKNDPEFQRMMVRRLQDLPIVRAIFTVGPDGRIIHDTDYPETPAVPLSDRPYFRAHLQDPALDRAVWPPLESRSGRGWFVPVTQRLGQSAKFEGVVVAAVQADHFRDVFQRAGLGGSYLIALFHIDGTLIASHPARPDDVGLRFGDLPAFASTPAPMGGMARIWKHLERGEHVVSYRVIQDLPLVAYVSRENHDVLAEWRRTATGAVVAMAALTLFLGWSVARLARASVRRRRERERRAQAEKLEALGQLTGGIAHDFGNMMQIVALNVALLRGAAPDPPAQRALDAIERAVGGGIRLVKQLMSFARRRPLAISRLRIDAWLEGARPLLTQLAGAQVALRIEAQPELPEIACDLHELDVALVNLVVNARDAGAGSIEVRAFACDDDSGAPKPSSGKPARYVCVSVKDTGRGMSEEVRRRAVEPFYTTKGEAGTGLGLSQVYGFVQQLGGSMAVESAPDRGTTIRLFFPVAKEQASERP